MWLAGLQVTVNRQKGWISIHISIPHFNWEFTDATKGETNRAEYEIFYDKVTFLFNCRALIVYVHV